MSVIGDVFGAGGVASFAQSIIERFVPDPAAKAAAIQHLEDNKVVVEKMEQDFELKLNDIAGQNIRADASSGDKFTQRARPTFMYIVEFILAFNYIMLPLMQVFGSKVQPLILPGDLLVLFGTCVTGYVMSRTADKALALPGASSVNLLGLKLSNDSNPPSK